MFTRRGNGHSRNHKDGSSDTDQHEVQPLMKPPPSSNTKLHSNNNKIHHHHSSSLTFNQKMIRCLIGLGLFVFLSKLLSGPQLKYVHWVDGFVRDIWIRAEQSGALQPFPAYKLDYADDFPHFSLLEDNYETIRAEAEALLLQREDHIPRLKDLVQKERAESKVYRVDWKVFWFKMGLWIPENCARAPETAKLIRKIPHLYNAFFSVLAPNSVRVLCCLFVCVCVS